MLQTRTFAPREHHFLWPLAVGAFSAGLSKIGQDDANASNAEQAQINREFTERMSNTQYQRARADLEAAGYNPMLAVSQGGAGNVSGSSAAAMQNSLSGAAQATGQIPTTLIQKAQVDNIQAQTDKTRAETWGQIISNKWANPQAQSGLTLQAGQTYETQARIQETNARQAEIQQRISQLDKTNQLQIAQQAQQLRQAISSADRADIEAATARLQQTLTRLGIPEAEAAAAFYTGLGKGAPYVSGAQALLNLLKGIIR